MMNGILSYPELLQHFQPRPITTEAQYDAAVKQMNALIDKGDLTADEQDFLTLLGTLIMAYEDEHYPDEMFELHGLELLKALMAEAAIDEEDLLPIFKSRPLVSAVLRGERPLTGEFIGKLAAFFGLPHEAFLEPAVALAA